MKPIVLIKSVCLSWFALMLLSVPLQAQTKPNIIVIVSDDAGYGDFSIQGSEQFQTPNIDHIARNGVRFTQGYVTASVCSPSRAGLLTGRYQQRFGHEYNIGSHQPSDCPDFIGLRSDQITLADALQSLGYHTGAVGKWHLGALDKYDPLNRGFDEFFGFRGGSAHYFGQGKKYFNIERQKDTVKVPVNYLTDAFGDEACRFIMKNRKRPFFLYLAFNAVHTPMEAREEDMAPFGYITEKKRRILGGMTVALDRSVGNVLRTLQENNLTGNTIVWFINDNGGNVGLNGSCNAPLNGKKGTFLEGGIRVPFYLQWPGGIPRGTVYTKPVISMDIFATSIAAAGGNAQALVNQLVQERFQKVWENVQKRKNPRAGEGWQLDGVNLLPYLTGKESGIPHEKLYWRRAAAAAIRDGNWKLIRLPDRPPLLYNVEKDISEQHNQAYEKPEMVRTLMKELFQWETGLAQPAWRTEPFWIRYNINLYDKKYSLTQPEGKMVNDR